MRVGLRLQHVEAAEALVQRHRQGMERIILQLALGGDGDNEMLSEAGGGSAYAGVAAAVPLALTTSDAAAAAARDEHEARCRSLRAEAGALRSDLTLAKLEQQAEAEVHRAQLLQYSTEAEAAHGRLRAAEHRHEQARDGWDSTAVDAAALVRAEWAAEVGEARRVAKDAHRCCVAAVAELNAERCAADEARRAARSSKSKLRDAAARADRLEACVAALQARERELRGVADAALAQQRAVESRGRARDPRDDKRGALLWGEVERLRGALAAARGGGSGDARESASAREQIKAMHIENHELLLRVDAMTINTAELREAVQREESALQMERLEDRVRAEAAARETSALRVELDVARSAATAQDAALRDAHAARDAALRDAEAVAAQLEQAAVDHGATLACVSESTRHHRQTIRDLQLRGAGTPRA